MLVIAFFALLAALVHKKPVYIISFILSLAFIIYRVILLKRPPVATLGESALFVSMILLGLSLYTPQSARLLSLFAAFLLVVAPLSNDPLQPVLRSNWWLMIHVITIVTSYGLLLGASALAHLLLVKKATSFKALERLLSWGTTLLIIGTMLGGIWASQSWGRFWDWDPKETWAFISACLYLVGIHAYRLGKIGGFGLALFAILAGASISFTWYGLNTIVTRGLHSYGFTEAPFAAFGGFLLFELLFCCFFLAKKLFAKKE